MTSHERRWVVAPIGGAVVTLGAIAVTVLVGFFLGFGLVHGALGKRSGDAAAKAAQVHAKLVRIQAPLGMAAVVLGVWTLV